MSINPTIAISVGPGDVTPGDRVILHGVVVGPSGSIGGLHVRLDGNEHTKTNLSPEAQLEARFLREISAVIEPGCKARGRATGRVYDVVAVSRGFAFVEGLGGPPAVVSTLDLERVA